MAQSVIDYAYKAWKKIDKKRENRDVDDIVANHPGMGTVPKALEGELVAAGWPSCLAAVAGEAINGWLPRTADSFEKIDKIGQGACSIVYKARDTTNGKVVALKKVRFDNLDPETVKFMAREILILRRLDHPNIIKLEGLITSRMSCSLYLVFEYMEHDLMGLTSLPGIKFSEPQVKCYMQQLLSGLEHCHSRGILHRDIKVSNLLIDNHGILKIADFGSASFFNQQQSQPLTSRVVTLWYRPPELLLGATHYGVSVDLWSTGCILGELYAGKAIMPGRTEVEQLHKIFKLCGSPSEDYWRESKLPHSTIFKPQQSYKRCLVETFKDFPMAALGLMEILLSIYPAHRGTTTSALKSEFFTTNPLACDPSTLPKYPPSKEIDAKVRDEEAGRVFKSTGVVKKRVNRSRQVRNDPIEKKKENTDVVANHPSMGMVPNTIEGEQVAAGWPSWLAAVAGEAINGWLPRKADSFEKLDEIGQGTYSSVYKARDLTNKKFVALKRVRFDNLYLKSVKFMAREIIILRRLDHPNIIKLEGLITSRTSCSLDLVFDYMEHDLTGLASLPGVKFSEPQIKCYMQQLLSGLEHCHSHGILHRDIKGSNLLVDNHGILKIADFGLASFFDHQQSQPLTNRFVTLCYQPPEILLGATHYGVSVDLWSTGCILGELYAGKAIMPGRTEVEQLHKIFNLCGSPSEDYWRNSKLPHSTVCKPIQPYKRRLSETFKDIPMAAIGLMEILLSIDPAHRGTTTSALKSEFFTTNPFACDPSSLPKYPPSKEVDAKLRDEEARRQRAAGGKVQSVDQETMSERHSGNSSA